MTIQRRNLLQPIRQQVHGKGLPVSQQGAEQAAVLMALTESPSNPELILTRRSPHLSSHAGEVALPGGKWEPGDTDLAVTALRESEEEIALPPARVELLGALPQAQSRWGLQVVPFVGIIPPQIELVANADEIDRIFRVPLRFFLENPRVEYSEREHEGILYRIPGFHYEGQIIWGLTAHFITDFCNRVFDAGFDHFRPVPITQSASIAQPVPNTPQGHST